MKARLSEKLFMFFVGLWMKTDFRSKTAYSVTFIVRFRATRKWPMLDVNGKSRSRETQAQGLVAS